MEEGPHIGTVMMERRQGDVFAQVVQATMRWLRRQKLRNQRCCCHSSHRRCNAHFYYHEVTQMGGQQLFLDAGKALAQVREIRPCEGGLNAQKTMKELLSAKGKEGRDIESILICGQPVSSRLLFLRVSSSELASVEQLKRPKRPLRHDDDDVHVSEI